MGTKYLFIDEVRNVAGFEEVVNGFRTEGVYSIFITRSNAYLLSDELATELTGRYIEFEMLTLSFGEYCEMKRFLGKSVNANLTAELDSYILERGFPRALYHETPQDKWIYVASVIAEIFEKDVRKRVKVENVSVFNQVQAYIINNLGATTSLTNILQDIAKHGVAIKRETEDREYHPREKIKDNYRKYVVTRNDPIQQRSGIIHVNIPEIMIGGEEF